MHFIKSYFNRIKKSTIIKGTLILTIAGFLTRIIGFLFRIFLNNKIGAEGLGIYQLIFPIQIICYSVCTIGFETAISKMTAASVCDGVHYPKRYLKYGLILSFTMSLIMSFVLFRFSGYICGNILFEKRCDVLIKALAFSIPLSSIHACICGYYIGCKNSNITALSQVIEQLSRVISIVAIINYIENIGIKPSPLSAVIGSVIGELISCVFCIFHISNHIRLSRRNHHPVHHLIQSKNKKMIVLEITKLSIPISLNRLMLSVLQSIQSILIPNMLILHGYSSEKALGIYGILLGLVIPFILFPGAIINSMSLLLLPTISQADSNDNTSKIRITTEKTLQFCLIFGIFCAAIFMNYGKDIGLYFLSDKEAGTYMCLLGILCPFIYVTSTLASIINGLGKTAVTFAFGIISTLLQIASIVFMMPEYGVYGYIIGFLTSNILNAFCLYLYIRKQIGVSIKLFSWILYPVLAGYVVTQCTGFVTALLPFDYPVAKMVMSLFVVTIAYILLFRDEFKL